MQRGIYLLVALLGMAAVSTMAAPELDESAVLEMFNSWKQEYGKVYESAEEMLKRLSIFAQNLNFIREHNRSGKTWTMAMNEFGDLTWEEFKATRLSSMPMEKTNEGIKRLDLSAFSNNVPDSVDWVSQGMVNAVQNQGQCGSCWAFSAVAAVESSIAISTGKLMKLSEQELVDCAGPYGCAGCNGGIMDRAFQYIEDEGLCSEQSYAYRARKAWRCGATKNFFSKGCQASAFIGKFVDVDTNNEVALKAAVAEQPVSIAIEADHQNFQFYSGGVYSGDCGTSLDHGVVLVGYGTDESTGEDFWKIRNSWGESWGEEGYIRVVRKNTKGEPGICGLAMMPSYPLSCPDASNVKCKQSSQSF